jgi:uncharacterized circularly permuted ATP-grasp superfamily protein/uncharacterized alpha-E superfamily protein
MQYQPDASRYDEAVAPDGSVRQGWRVLSAALASVGVGELAERQRQADRMLDAEGAGHLVHDLTGRGVASRPWRLDPVPMLIEQAEFDLLARAAAQRVRVLEAVMADLYGERTLVRTGVVPAAEVAASPSLRMSAGLQRPARWLVQHAVDMVRTADGTWRVLGDFTDSPTGLGYALLNRSITARVMAEPLRAAGTSPVGVAAAVLRRALAALAPTGRTDTRTVVLSGGSEHPSYVEHSYLAVQMGLHLAEGGDLVMRQDRLWLRALGGLEPVDVVYRRLEDAGLDPLEPRAQGVNGVPAITWAAQRGGVVLGNAFGTGVGEIAAVQQRLADVAGALVGESLLLRPYAGEPLATTPVYDAAQGLVPGRVVLRLNTVVGPDGIWVMPGGAGRVLADGDHPAAPTAERTKDVWVVGGARSGRAEAGVSASTATAQAAAVQQVDFGASVPKRAADALYWMGRAAERAEVAARAARVVGAQVEQDPYLVTLAGGGWAMGAVALLRSAQGAPQRSDAVDGAPLAEVLQRELAATRATVAHQVSSLVNEARSVREYLSTTTGRVLGRLARVVSDLVRTDAAVDDLDLILIDLAALAGLATESTVRGPAWRFLDLGRRIERGIALLGSVEAAVGQAVDPLAFQPLIEAVLAANESLVAYRRRYRSDVELHAVVDLLVRDDVNPRGLAFQLDRLREHLASLAWPEGGALVEQAVRATFADLDDVVVRGRRLSVDGLVLAARGPLLQLDAAVVARWFADPVNPMVLGGR